SASPNHLIPMRGFMFRAFILFPALSVAMMGWSTLAPAQAPAGPPERASAPQAAAPAQHDPDEVLVENAQMKLTRADYDADIQRVPAEMRNEFASDPKRLSAYLNNLLIVRTLAADARKAGLANDPLLQRRAALETDRLLAQAQLQHLEEAAGREFDAKSSEYKVKAKELYLIDRSKYRSPEQISASQILFDTKRRTPEEALALANETRRKLLAGADFAAIAKEMSDDPSARNNGGEIGWFTRERMDPAFSNAAFEMKNVGDISEPVLSRIMAELRKQYIDAQRDARSVAIRTDPTLKVNQPAVDALVFRADPEIFSMPRRGSAEPLRGSRDKKGTIAPQ